MFLLPFTLNLKKMLSSLPLLLELSGKQSMEIGNRGRAREEEKTGLTMSVMLSIASLYWIE